MSTAGYLDDVSLPVLIRTQLVNHLARLERVADRHALELAPGTRGRFCGRRRSGAGLNPATMRHCLWSLITRLQHAVRN